MSDVSEKRRERSKKRVRIVWVYLASRRLFRTLTTLGPIVVPLVRLVIEIVQLIRG